MEQNAISSDLIRGHIDTIILHTLLESDKFAQQISDAIDEKSGNEYKINQATLYSALKRLENLKYVKSYWYDADTGRRKYFTLTENGKATVEANLSSWTFSRAIIDKLMDCEQQPVYKTEYVEKIIEKPVEIVKVVTSHEINPVNSIESKPSKAPDIYVRNMAASSQVSSKIIEKEPKKAAENPQDINFRNILNGLIKTSSMQNNTAKSNVIDEKPAQPEVKDLNKTLTDNSVKTLEDKDFGDLKLQAAKDNYKVRVSSKDSYETRGTVLLNKLNAYVSVFAFAIAFIALLVISLGVGSGSSAKVFVAIFGSILCSLPPAYLVLKYLVYPNDTTAKKIGVDGIITAGIIAFNVLVVSLVINLICGVNFANGAIIAFSFVLPNVLAAIYVGAVALRYVGAKFAVFQRQRRRKK